jgi:hypothetical protein
MLSSAQIVKNKFKKCVLPAIGIGIVASAAISAAVYAVLGDSFTAIVPIISTVLSIGLSLAAFFGVIIAKTPKSDELDEIFRNQGYCRDFCDAYADAFVNNVKKPDPVVVIELVSYLNKIGDLKSASFYLDNIDIDKLSGNTKFEFCREQLLILGKSGNWRDGEDFRSENIKFIQLYLQHNKDMRKKAEMYIALSFIDCAAKKYSDAFSLLNCGYKPTGKSDVCFLEILITAVYIYAKMGDGDNVQLAIGNASKFLDNFTGFEYKWTKDYYKKRIESAANGKL